MSLDLLLIQILGAAIALPLAYRAWCQADALGNVAILVRGMLLYVVVAFLLKGALLEAVAWEPAIDAIIVPRALSASQSVTTAIVILAYSIAVILCCLQVASIFARRVVSQNDRMPAGYGRSSINRVLLLLVLLLPYKFVVNYVMRWGVPAHIATNTIPVVTGFSVFLVRDVMLCVCATLLYLVFARPGAERYRARVMLGVGTYLLLDLGIGSKFGMLGLIFVALPLVARSFIAQDARARFRTLLLMALVAVFFFPLYQLANVLRFIRLDEALGLWDIALKASEKVDIDLLKMVFSVLGRATGAEGAATAVVLDGRLRVDLIDLVVRSDFAQNYGLALTGIVHENAAFGSTLAGAYSFHCRTDAVCIGVIAYLSTMIQLGGLVLLTLAMPLSPAVRFAVAVSFALLVVHAQLASGGLAYFLNRVAVTLMAGALLEALLRYRPLVWTVNAAYPGRTHR